MLLCPVIANHLSCYDTVLFPSRDYVKTLLEFVIQHSSSTKLNKKISFHAVIYSRLLEMINNSLLVVSASYFLHVKKYIISHQAV